MLFPGKVQLILLTLVVTGHSSTDFVNKTQNVWQIYSYGDSKKLRLVDLPIPPLTEPNQLLIKINAVALNPLDLEMLGGYGKSFRNILGWFKSIFPIVLGREFSGTVVDKAPGISEAAFKIGDEVYGIVPVEQPGSLREYIVANRLNVLLKPPQLTNLEAGAVLFTSLTAWNALFLTGGIATRDPTKTTVLVVGASGGVGTVATQILKSQNATVVGLCSTDAVPLVKTLGATYVYDYKKPEHIHQVASHGTYDIIFDCANYGYEKVPNEWKYKTFILLDAPIIRNADRYGVIGGLLYSGGQLASANALQVLRGKSVQWAFFSPNPDGAKFIDKLIRDNQLKPIIQDVFNFTQVPEAFERLSAKHSRGKIVINFQ